MVDAETVRQIANSLPLVEDGSTPSALRFSVAGKAFAWSLNQRPDGQAKGPRIPVLAVLAVRCGKADKPDLLASDPETLYEIEHYRGYPAVLVRLDRVEADTLRGLLIAGWRVQAPRGLVKAFKTL